MQKSESLKIGAGCIKQVAQMLVENHVSGKLLYISDSVVDALYGSEVKRQIQEVGKLKEEYVNYNTIAYAMSIAEKVIVTDVDCIVGMGGGKVLDVCKYASYISKIPFLSIPTTAANDGMASPIAVLKQHDNKPKSLGCRIAPMLLVDTTIIEEGPPQLIKAGIGDTISNYMALMDWELACKRGKDTMNDYARLMSQSSLDTLMKTQFHGINSEFVKVLVNSLVLSGIAMDFAGSSRPVSGSEHLFSHALDYYSPQKNLHGIQTGLGTVASLKLTDKDPTEVIEYLERFDVDTNPKHLGIDKDTFIYSFQHAINMRPNRYTYLHETDLSTERLEKVYQWLTVEL